MTTRMKAPRLWLVVIATLAGAEASLAQESSVAPLARQVTTNLTLKLPVG